MKELILGGARSGKSALAERVAAESGLDVIYLATATVGDEAMAERIDGHRQRRPAHWQTIEEPAFLARVLQEQASAERCILVDCLTLWLTHLMFNCPTDTSLEAEKQAFLDILPELPGSIILVSNETGLGIVPLGEATRRFVDEAGLLHQQLAQLCQRVTLVVAGLPHRLKEEDK